MKLDTPKSPSMMTRGGSPGFQKDVSGGKAHCQESRMSIWRKIIEAVQSLVKGDSLGDIFRSKHPPERTVAFTVAVVALGAKIAKADGRVTRDEVDAFRHVFFVSPHEEKNAARVFNMAREDSAGYESYAERIAAMFTAPQSKATLEDILDGLFYIAGADGVYDPAEITFLAHVASIFRLDKACFERLRTRHDPAAGGDPYAVLGVTRDTPMAEVEAVWRAFVRENHPDRMLARGVPKEAVRLANDKLRAINNAYERIQTEKG